MIGEGGMGSRVSEQSERTGFGVGACATGGGGAMSVPEPTPPTPAPSRGPGAHTDAAALPGVQQEKAEGASCPSFSLLAEKRQDNGRVYYVNHNTRTTQWEDPRTQG